MVFVFYFSFSLFSMGKQSIATVTTAALVDWDNTEMQAQIKEMYGKNLQPAEWNMFMQMGKATGLNPFLREIWAVKYGNNAASVFVGRDGYRRSAQAHPEYEYHYAMAVYANDAFSIKSGIVDHEFSGGDRGALIGAYCVVKRKSSSKEAVTWVSLSEYLQKGGVWVAKPATMITKVAEAQGLRASFQELFAGTYEESENWQDDKRIVDATPQERQTVRDAVQTETTATQPVNPAQPYVIDASEIPAGVVVEVPPVYSNAKGGTMPPAAPKPAATAPVTSPRVPKDDIPVGKLRGDQTKKLFAVWGEYKKILKMTDDESTKQRKELMKSMFNVETSTSLNERQADELIERIEALTELIRAPEGNTAGDSF